MLQSCAKQFSVSRNTENSDHACLALDIALDITSLSKIVPCVGLIVCANWLQVGRVRSGVRALPQKTLDGALPLAGKLASSTQEHK